MFDKCELLKNGYETGQSTSLDEAGMVFMYDKTLSPVKDERAIQGALRDIGNICNLCPLYNYCDPLPGYESTRPDSGVAYRAVYPTNPLITEGLLQGDSKEVKALTDLVFP